jgi:chromosome segregation ATPase
MHMDRLIALSLATGLAFSMIGLGARHVAAQSAEAVDLSKLATLQADFEAAKAKDASLIAAMTKGVEDSAALVEKHKALVAQLTALKPEGESLKTALSNQNAEVEKQRAATTAHNAACPHEAKDAAQAAKCNEEVGRLNTWTARIKAETDRLTPLKAKYNSEIEDIQKRDRDVIAQLDAIRSADTDQRKQLDVVREHAKQLRAALSAGKARCRAIEKAATDPANEEDLHYCKAIGQVETPVWQAPSSNNAPAEASPAIHPKN